MENPQINWFGVIVLSIFIMVIVGWGIVNKYNLETATHELFLLNNKTQEQFYEEKKQELLKTIKKCKKVLGIDK